MDAPETRPSRRRYWSVLLWTAALLPFCGAVFAHAVGPRPQRPSARSKPPALVFNQYMVNLGRVQPVPVVRGRFRFTNRSDRTVKITELKPSCGCLNPRLEKRVYRPGETGEFFVRVTTAGQKPGRQEYTVGVAYEDPEPREDELTFKVVLPDDQILVRPRALIFYQLSGRATTRQLTVTDRRPQPLKPLNVIGLSCPSPLVEAAVVESGRDEQGDRRIRVDVSVAGSVPPGTHRTVLTLNTDDPDYATLRVPLILRGPK